jgi:hypothetical protein
MISEHPARKHPQGKAHIDLVLPDEGEQVFSPCKEETSYSESVLRPVRAEMNQRFIRTHPGEPPNLDLFQEGLFLSFPVRGEDKDAMPPLLKSPDKRDEERGLNKIIRTGRKGRSDDADIHQFFYFNSLLYSISNHMAKKRD